MNFVEQFQQLLLEKPRYNVKQILAENSQYSETAIKSGNCYYCFCVFYCEDVYYGRYSRQCTSCSGISFCVDCQWCIDCTDCTKGYELFNCQSSDNCSYCQFCRDCFSCENCFGCFGLNKKKYCFFNKQLSKEAYQEAVNSLDVSNPAVRQKIQQQLEHLRTTNPTVATRQFRTEDCIGDNLSECKGCIQCFDAFNLEDCIYNIEANGNKDCLDISVCFETEASYMCVQAPLNFDCKFLINSDQCNGSEFCAYSKNLTDCFGCVYLANKKHHILNKAYSPEEYKQKVSEIKSQLIENRQYNLLLYFVSDYEQQRLANDLDSVIQSQLPFDLGEFVEMNDKRQKLCCANPECGKDFLVISQEALMYEKLSLPLPDFCPACRHAHRMVLRNERALYRRTCECCKSSVVASYPDEAPYPIYCQDCFWQHIG